MTVEMLWRRWKNISVKDHKCVREGIEEVCTN